ncbi:MAG: hypothetical protein Q7S19_01735 [bacterium]|nr:hypothetical protein [bacterium]
MAECVICDKALDVEFLTISINVYTVLSKVEHKSGNYAVCDKNQSEIKEVLMCNNECLAECFGKLSKSIKKELKKIRAAEVVAKKAATSTEPPPSPNGC